MAHLFNEEQINFIKKNVKGVLNKELAQMVNKKFNLNITTRQMKTWKKNHNLSSGLKGSEGLAPPNKGTKGKYNVGGNRTSFKPGQIPSNYLPVGSETVSKDGYVYVKVTDVGHQFKKWRPKHRVIWEQVHGPIPKSHCLIFLDGNKNNITLENLQLVSRGQLARLNKDRLIFNNPELTEIGILVAKLSTQIGKCKNSLKEVNNK